MDDITILCCHLELLCLGPTAAPVPGRTVVVTLDNSWRGPCPIWIDRRKALLEQEKFPRSNSSGLREPERVIGCYLPRPLQGGGYKMPDPALSTPYAQQRSYRLNKKACHVFAKPEASL